MHSLFFRCLCAALWHIIIYGRPNTIYDSPRICRNGNCCLHSRQYLSLQQRNAVGGTSSGRFTALAPICQFNHRKCAWQHVQLVGWQFGENRMDREILARKTREGREDTTLAAGTRCLDGILLLSTGSRQCPRCNIGIHESQSESLLPKHIVRESFSLRIINYRAEHG